MAKPLLDFEALAKACVDGDLDTFAEASIHCPNLRRLNLVGGGRLEVKSLLAFVERLPKLEALHISEIEALEGEPRERVHELVQRFSRQP